MTENTVVRPEIHACTHVCVRISDWLVCILYCNFREQILDITIILCDGYKIEKKNWCKKPLKDDNLFYCRTITTLVFVCARTDLHLEYFCILYVSNYVIMLIYHNIIISCIIYCVHIWIGLRYLIIRVDWFVWTSRALFIKILLAGEDPINSRNMV
jgi:hypothetical protein